MEIKVAEIMTKNKNLPKNAQIKAEILLNLLH